MYDLDDHFLVGKLEQALLEGFHGTLNVRLDDQIEFLQGAFLHLGEQIVQVHAHPGLFDQLFLMLCLVGGREGLGSLIAVMGDNDFARAGNVGKSQDLDRAGRAGFFDPASLIIDHGTDLTGAGARGNKVAYMQCTLLDQDVGDGPAALIQLGFEDKASGQTFGIGLELQDIRCQQDGLEQVFNAFAGLGGYRNKFCGSAPVCGDQLIVGHFLFDLFNIGVRLINLVEHG